MTGRPAPDFSGRRAVVTGGAHGIGAATCRLLRERGAAVVVLDREEPADVLVDLSDQAATRAAADDALRRLGGVEVLVNCAGTASVASLRALDWDAYQRTLAVNLHAPVLLMQALSEPMVAGGYGRIVNVTSVHARHTEPGSLAYDITKAGLESATRTAAVELADHGVLVNAVAPGFVDTRMAVVDGRSELEGEEFQRWYVDAARLPLRRAAHPQEVAAAIAWLASASNTYATGQSLVVDGGLTARF